MTKLRVSAEIFQAFPDAILGVVIVQDIDNKGESSQVMQTLRLEEGQIPGHLGGVSVNDHPNIAPWREAYRKFGAKPKDYPSSIENLVRRVLKGHQLPHINLIVDIYNSISLQHIVPVGGEDLDKIEGDIELTFAGENEPPVRLLGEPEARAPKPGEVIYKDRISAICRRWNWKEADRTKFTEETKNGILIIEGLPPVDRNLIQKVIEELASLVQAHCGGTVRIEIVSGSNPEIIL
jgi:DNA/RNA-binding domain of Phe-tRNA-synthetase-like protein